MAGKLGVSNNPRVSSAAQRNARQDILHGAKGNDRHVVAGKIGVAQNPNAPRSVQHAARINVISIVAKDGKK